MVWITVYPIHRKITKTNEPGNLLVDLTRDVDTNMVISKSPSS
jgi:hypothetical protein